VNGDVIVSRWREVEELAHATSFSGVVSIVADGSRFVRAFGFADRAHRIANEVTTRFALASGAKTYTALAVLRLVEEGILSLDTTARSVLGDDLPLIADDVTVEHLLSHRSGIGDYLDETLLSGPNDYVMPVPVHRLATTEDYLLVLDGHPTAFPAGTRFAYCNGGFVVLALIAERASAVPFPDLVRRQVCERAGLRDTGFLRTDELPGDVAIGYLEAEGLRTNALHLPVLGSGDGGISSTVADVEALWTAMLEGRIVRPDTASEMIRARSTDERDGSRYGLGLWLDLDGPGVAMEGADAGVSFRSRHDPETATTTTVLSNTSRGAWPLVEILERIDP
jgi:CubicO group peptidase (beta-lactamase class C family)